ncbi:HEAT repeat domain-containing protein [Myxococcaceae bacterium GXIMD 01537]
MMEAVTSREEERYQALLALDPEVPGALDVLTAGLHDESWRVRRAAAEGMRRLPAPASVARHLIAVLGERGETGARNAAAEALVGLGEVAVAPLVELLAHPDPDQRKFAADILGQLGLPAAEDALVAALEDLDLNVRAAAAEALGRVGGERAVRALHEALGSPDSLLRLAALEALVELRRPATLAVVTRLLEVPRLRRSAYRMLGLLSEVAATELLCQGLGAETRSLREAALGALGTQASRVDAAAWAQAEPVLRGALQRLPEVRELLEQALGAEDLPVRAGALVAVAAVGEASLAVPVAEAAREDRLLREVIRTLTLLGPDGGRELLAHMEELSQPARAAAAQALLEVVDASSVPALRGLLEWAEDDLRAMAVKALGRTRCAEAVAPLVELLDDAVLAGAASRALSALSADCAEKVARALESVVASRASPAAVAAMARAGGPGCLPVLRRLARDVDPRLRASAVEAVAKVDAEAGLELARVALADESSPVRAAAARVVGRRGGPTAGALLTSALRDEDAEVRLAAVEAVGECGALDRVPELEAWVRHPDGAVAGQAVRALARLGALGAGLLREAARHADPEVVKAALGAGAGASEGRALAVELLGHARWDVRAAAARALGGAGGQEGLEAARAALASEQDTLARRALMDAVERLSGR